MKIVLVAGRHVLPDFGGQGSFCRYLAEGLVHLGHGVTIVGEPGWSDVCRSLGARHSSRLSFGAVRAADIVHVNGPGRKAALITLALRRPLLVTHLDYSYLCPAATAWTPEGCYAGAVPGPCTFCPKKGLRAIVGVRALRQLCKYSANVAVSRSLLDRLQIPGGTSVLNPIRPRPEAGSGTDGLLVFAGRLAPEKGVDLLLRAVAKLPGARLEIAGDGPEEEYLKSLAQSPDLKGRVRFHGWLSHDHLDSLLRHAAIVCVPSLWPEPFGYAAAEAMAAARPVIATDSGAFAELLAEGRGWLCPPNAEAWAAALSEALAQPAERIRRAERALQFVCAELDPVRVAARYLQAYEAAVQ